MSRLLPLAACAALACAGSPDAATIAALERDLAAALARRDSVTLERLLAPGFPAASREGRNAGVTRELWLSIMLRRWELDTIALGTVTVQASGDTARAGFWLYWRGTVMGQALVDESLLVEDVWVRRGGGWRLGGRDILDCRPVRTEC